MPPKIGCVCEAASVERPGCLLEGGGKRWVGLERSSWSGDKRKECIANLNVGCMAVYSLEEWDNRSKVELVRINLRYQTGKITQESSRTATRFENSSEWDRLQRNNEFKRQISGIYSKLA